MNELLLYGPIALPAAAILLILAILYQMSRSALLMGARLDSFEKSLEMATRLIKEEIGQSRAESGRMLGDQRREVGESFRELSSGILQRISEAHCAQGRQFDALAAQFSDFTRSNQEQLAHLEKQAAESSKALREEVVGTLTKISESIGVTIKDLGTLQKNHMDSFSSQIAATAKVTTNKLDASFQESSALAKSLREEVVSTLTKISESMSNTLKDLSAAEKVQLDTFSAQLTELTRSTSGSLDTMRVQASANAKELREEIVKALTGISETTARTMGELGKTQKSQLDAMAAAMNQLSETNAAKLETVRSTVETKLQMLQTDNAKQLENMRQTVDEKLQGTLEKRLGESFRQVSERLEQVHKGLGEMQTLATGVGDLKKVLTNVKTRGTWGEIQLGALLEQVLSAEQYVRNASTREGAERVEFAVKLPGQNGDAPVLLPVDAKFPVEDYQRLLDAQERADAEGIDMAGRQLETRIKACARDIRDKYINPPASTDFGILFLPIEGLFAEVIRRPGLAECIQRDCRVVIAGPTTLWSILNSLQMGFRTLAIQKRSSEVWTLLGAVKTEWTKYGEVLDAVQKRINQASETIEKAKVRTRAIGRKLRNVQEMPIEESSALLSLPREGEDGELAVERQ
ncbi:DNA recombination protein RmuC [Desulfomicrobium macestii]|uniref:DNA recombination protein RmuC n=1 Tax=Desulfomicrobium macestii TaxID=90731 RepID=A0ABR9H2B1_9BACT|nr:DNA recombination protein RmuC [Desulfomicrobium macestii]MBE1424842.1 DNA recombination protein RmuC [Desulfomicrobium macestii]